MSFSSTSETPSWKIKLLYDGDCPLCVREVNFLRQKDASQGKIMFVNIADDNYSPADHGNIDYATAMNRIHAILADGTIVTNLEVFRQLYDIIGLGWVYSFTNIPLLGWITDQIYGIWATWRLKITHRPDLITLVHQRNQRLKSTGNLTCNH